VDAERPQRISGGEIGDADAVKVELRILAGDVIGRVAVTEQLEHELHRATTGHRSGEARKAPRAARAMDDVLVHRADRVRP
jgi:streptogramin lyase